MNAALSVAVPNAGPSPRRLRTLVWGTWTVAIGLAAIAGLFILASLTVDVPSRGFGFRGWVPLVGVLWATTGARIAARQPHIAVGWLMLAVGALWCVNAFFEEYATFSYFPQEIGLPLVPQMVWFNTVVGSAVAGLSGLTMLVIPDGKLRSRRWYPVALGVVMATLVSMLTLAVLPRRLSPFPFDNPYGIAALRELAAPYPVLRWLDVLRGLVVVIPAIAVVLRYRASRDVQRRQLKWVAVAAAYTALTVLVYAFNGEPPVQYAQLLGLVFVPLAFAVAMRRHRLYDIDRLLNRTIVFGLATALLAGLYTASIGIIQRIFIALTGERSDAAVVLTTLIAAAAFAPVKDWVQLFVKRTFGVDVPGTHGLKVFTDEVEAHLRLSDPDRLLTQLLAESVASLGALGGALERPDGGAHPLHAIGTWVGTAHLSAEVRQRGSVVARVMLAQRANGEEYDAAARARLERSANVVGMALDRIPLPSGADR